jgi:transcriptional regulator with XRE-family HTH domain
MRPENRNVIDYVAVGKRIKQIRKEKGYSIKEIAGLTGLNEMNLGQIERGKRRVGLTTLVLLSDIFNVDINSLLFDRVEKAENAEKGKLVEPDDLGEPEDMIEQVDPADDAVENQVMGDVVANAAMSSNTSFETMAVLRIMETASPKQKKLILKLARAVTEEEFDTE